MLHVEDFGAKGDGMTDDTGSIESFFNAMVQQHLPGKMEEKKIYKLTREMMISMKDGEEFQLHGNQSTLLSVFESFPSCGVRSTVKFWGNDHEQENKTLISISDLTVDCSQTPYFESTKKEDLRGMGGIMIRYVDTVQVSKYTVQGCYFASGLGIYRHLNATLDHITMRNVGTKFCPHTDSTAGEDCAGDALYFEMTKNGTTTLTDVDVRAYEQAYGRAGIVFENFDPELKTKIHPNVIMTNVNIHGYQRSIHEEDHGVSLIRWTHGSVSRFSTALMTWMGTRGYICEDVSFDVSPEFRYGYGMGLTNCNVPSGLFVFRNCPITYQTECLECGNQLFDSCPIFLNSYVVKHGTTLSFLNCQVKRTSGYIRIVNDGIVNQEDVVIQGGRWENLACGTSIPSVLFSSQCPIRSSSNVTWIRCSYQDGSKYVRCMSCTSCGKTCCESCCSSCDYCANTNKCRYYCWYPSWLLCGCWGWGKKT